LDVCAENTTFRLRKQPYFFCDLNSLRTSFGAELVEQTARVGLNGVFADEEFFSDLAVGHALGNEFEDFQFALRDAEVLQSLFIYREGHGGRHGDFLNDQDFLFLRQLQAEPDADSCEECGDQAAVDLKRVFDDHEAKLDQPERHNQNSTAQAVDQDVDKRLLLHGSWDSTTKFHAKAQRKRQDAK
jgi:hypothetical protein